jgi:hypothetical protein
MHKQFWPGDWKEADHVLDLDAAGRRVIMLK